MIMIFTCDNCGFIFSRSEETEQCPDCGKKHSIFGESHIGEIADAHGLKVLAQLPMDPALAAACDAGKVEELPVNYLAEVAKGL